MSDESPNALVMSPRPLVARMGRWPLYALLVELVGDDELETGYTF